MRFRSVTRNRNTQSRQIAESDVDGAHGGLRHSRRPRPIESDVFRRRERRLPLPARISRRHYPRNVSRSASSPVYRGAQPSSCLALLVSMIDGWLSASIHSTAGGTLGGRGALAAARARA